MVDLKGKKLLIIGGAFQHCKLVEAAKSLGVITYVTDYLPYESAPAKQIADKYFNFNITEIDEIVEMCKKEGINGVLSTSLDICQKPYYQVCKKLGVPCFGTEEQFEILTDKNAFKKCCLENGVDTIPEYSISDFEDKEKCEKKVEFPILIKPCVSRGSRGQSICNSFEAAKSAIPFAKSESANGEIVIEKYMGQSNDFSMTILVLNKKAYVTRTVDRILGKYEDGLDKCAVGSAAPSIFTDIYIEKAHAKIEKFIEAIGLVNAPIFMQGFVDGDRVRFYDPGLRLPGGEFERTYEKVFGINPLFPLIEFALTGEVSEENVGFSDNGVWLKGKTASQILPSLRPGKITEIKGMDKILSHPNVVSAFMRYDVGEEIKPTHNVNQRFCEIDLLCDSNEEMVETAEWVYNTLKVLDENGEDMVISKFSTDIYLDRNAFKFKK